MESVSERKLIELHKYVNIQHITTYGRYTHVNLHAKNGKNKKFAFILI